MFSSKTVMNIQINNLNFDMLSKATQHKMIFVFNALENGWTIQKQKNQFICTKPHEGKKEVFSDNFLPTFMKDNFDIKNIVDK